MITPTNIDVTKSITESHAKLSGEISLLQSEFEQFKEGYKKSDLAKKSFKFNDKVSDSKAQKLFGLLDTLAEFRAKIDQRKQQLTNAEFELITIVNNNDSVNIIANIEAQKKILKELELQYKDTDKLINEKVGDKIKALRKGQHQYEIAQNPSVYQSTQFLLNFIASEKYIKDMLESKERHELPKYYTAESLNKILSANNDNIDKLIGASIRSRLEDYEGILNASKNNNSEHIQRALVKGFMSVVIGLPGQEKTLEEKLTAFLAKLKSENKQMSEDSKIKKDKERSIEKSDGDEFSVNDDNENEDELSITDEDEDEPLEMFLKLSRGELSENDAEMRDIYFMFEQYLKSDGAEFVKRVFSANFNDDDKKALLDGFHDFSSKKIRKESDFFAKNLTPKLLEQYEENINNKINENNKKYDNPELRNHLKLISDAESRVNVSLQDKISALRQKNIPIEAEKIPRLNKDSEIIRKDLEEQVNPVLRRLGENLKGKGHDAEKIFKDLQTNIGTLYQTFIHSGNKEYRVGIEGTIKDEQKFSSAKSQVEQIRGEASAKHDRLMREIKNSVTALQSQFSGKDLETFNMQITKIEEGAMSLLGKEQSKREHLNEFINNKVSAWRLESQKNTTILELNVNAESFNAQYQKSNKSLTMEKLKLLTAKQHLLITQNRHLCDLTNNVSLTDLPNLVNGQKLNNFDVQLSKVRAQINEITNTFTDDEIKANLDLKQIKNDLNGLDLFRQESLDPAIKRYQTHLERELNNCRQNFDNLSRGVTVAIRGAPLQLYDKQQELQKVTQQLQGLLTITANTAIKELYKDQTTFNAQKTKLAELAVEVDKFKSDITPTEGKDQLNLLVHVVTVNPSILPQYSGLMTQWLSDLDKDKHGLPKDITPQKLNRLLSDTSNDDKMISNFRNRAGLSFAMPNAIVGVKIENIERILFKTIMSIESPKEKTLFYSKVDQYLTPEALERYKNTINEQLADLKTRKSTMTSQQFENGKAALTTQIEQLKSFADVMKSQLSSDALRSSTIDRKSSTPLPKLVTESDIRKSSLPQGLGSEPKSSSLNTSASNMASSNNSLGTNSNTLNPSLRDSTSGATSVTTSTNKKDPDVLRSTVSRSSRWVTAAKPSEILPTTNNSSPNSRKNSGFEKAWHSNGRRESFSDKLTRSGNSPSNGSVSNESPSNGSPTTGSPIVGFESYTKELPKIPPKPSVPQLPLPQDTFQESFSSDLRSSGSLKKSGQNSPNSSGAPSLKSSSDDLRNSSRKIK